MNRLTHSSGAALRIMQISAAQVFAFVEGGLDRPFAEKILDHAFTSRATFRIFAIKEVNGGTGGKIAVLKHFDYLKKRGMLLGEAWGKKFVSLFFVDKDADDALNRKRRSPHLAYTPTYDIEGALFCFGNVIRAFSDTCLITTEQAKSIIGDPKEWLQQVTINWADWITLCIISQQKKINLGCTYDRPSTINPDPLHPPDLQMLADWKNKFMTKLSMSSDDFDMLYNRLHSKVVNSINNGEPLRFFKGKWLQLLLQKQIEVHPKIPDSNTNSLGDRIITSLLGQIAISSQCNCLRHYVPFIQGALRLI